MRSLPFTASMILTLVLAARCGDEQSTVRPADVDPPRGNPVTAGAVRSIDAFPRLPGETQQDDGPRFNRAIAAMHEGEVLQLSRSW
jgi:hypothetical protein